jgi:hypothetical protein
MLRLDVELLLNKLDYSTARALAADLSGALYNGEETARRYWYKGAAEATIKDWLRVVLNQDPMPDTLWVEDFIREQVWG